MKMTLSTPSTTSIRVKVANAIQVFGSSSRSNIGGSAGERCSNLGIALRRWKSHSPGISHISIPVHRNEAQKTPVSSAGCRRVRVIDLKQIPRTSAMDTFTPIPAAIGGVLIGLSAALLWLGNGRIAGISGLFGQLLPPARTVVWR